ncbi:hypothetical protein [Phyllobacterium lublinensis]|uniref:hypothetical protein n=1 Tax=Phyllobacterium lublinensis TaxID=2875708 RepID=UPI001CCEB5EE|nr:hypothetical protein [Phyllobacterium sp. 2063]MBZ9653772.1 hypothetical protein [Phyllobacterium sp. 2063]
MYNKNEVLTIKTSKVKIKKTAYSLLSVKGMPTIAFVMAASLCTMLPANAGEVRSNSMKLGYSGSAKTYVITRKNIKTRNVVTVAKSAYLGQAPFICTPSGFGRTSTCFAR